MPPKPTPYLPKGWKNDAPASRQSSNRIPNLKVPCVLSMKSSSSRPRYALKLWMFGTLASPTPTVPMEEESIRVIFVGRLARNLARQAPALQPAVPPPTIAMEEMASSDIFERRKLKK